MRLRWRRRRDLAERLRPYVPERIAPEPMVDADPIRMFLHRWMIETGDPIDVVARGFGIDEQLLIQIVDRDVRFLRATTAAHLAAIFGLSACCG
ncbi:MAG: hypothetical protein AAF567_11895 [Actinomycetota bacterium]